MVDKAEPNSDIRRGSRKRESLMASRYFGSGSILESDILNPAKSTLLPANWILSGLSTIPA